MVCKSIIKLLNDYLADRLDPETRTLVDEHLAQCESCRKALKNEDHISQFLSSANSVDTDDSMLDSLMEKVQETAAQTQKKTPFSLTPLSMTARCLIAAVMALFFAGTALLVFKFNAVPERYFRSYGMEGFTWIGVSENDFVIERDDYPQESSAESNIGWGGSMAAISGIVLPGEDEGRVSHSFSLPDTDQDFTRQSDLDTYKRLDEGDQR